MENILNEIRPYYLAAKNVWDERRALVLKAVEEANRNFDLNLTETDATECVANELDTEYSRLDHNAHVTFMKELEEEFGFYPDDDGISYVMDRYVVGDYCVNWNSYDEEYTNVNTFDECALKVIQEHKEFNKKPR